MTSSEDGKTTSLASQALPVWLAALGARLLALGAGLAGLGVGLIASFGYFGLVFFTTKYSYRWSVVLGLLCSLLLASVALILAALVYQFIREMQAAPNRSGERFLIPLFEAVTKWDFNRLRLQVIYAEFASLTVVVTLFLSSWASFAYGMAQLRSAAYDHTDRLSFWLMFKHYVWQLFDLVPLLDVWKHVHIEDPIIERSLWPGFLVIIFRLVNVFLVLSTVAKLLRPDKRNASDG